MAYNILNRLKWTGKLGDCKVIILHRGAPKNEKLILGKSITEIKKSYFMCLDEQSGEETYIPMHRVLRVEVGDKAVWERKRQKDSGR